MKEVNLTGPGTLAHPMKGLDFGPILEFSNELKADIEFSIDDSAVYVPNITVLKERNYHHASNDY